MRLTFKLTAVVLLEWSIQEASGQVSPAAPDSITTARSPACSAPEYRQFDFWIGEWMVTDLAGVQQGTSRITSVAGGCGIEEQWEGRDGVDGTSLNYYDAQTGLWNQHWVGGGGMVLHLEGGISEDGMAMLGERNTPRGWVLDRISWIPLDDGRVLQDWRISPDGGKTWNQAFVGWYEPNPASKRQ
jgi:hypothetical protein